MDQTPYSLHDQVRDAVIRNSWGDRLPAYVWEYIPTNPRYCRPFPAEGGGDLWCCFCVVTDILDEGRVKVELISTPNHKRIEFPTTATFEMGDENTPIPGDLEIGAQLWLPMWLISSLARYYEGEWDDEKFMSVLGKDAMITYIREPKHETVRDSLVLQFAEFEPEADPVPLDDLF